MDVKEMLGRAESWTFRQDAIINGTEGSLARVMTCNQEPRISVVSNYDRPSGRVTQVWRVDGIDHTCFNIALAKLIIDQEDAQ